MVTEGIRSETHYLEKIEAGWLPIPPGLFLVSTSALAC